MRRPSCRNLGKRAQVRGTGGGQGAGCHAVVGQSLVIRERRGSALACVEAIRHGMKRWPIILWEHKELMHAFLFWKLMTAAARRLVSGLALAGLPREAPARPIRNGISYSRIRWALCPHTSD